MQHIEQKCNWQNKTQVSMTVNRHTNISLTDTVPAGTSSLTAIPARKLQSAHSFAPRKRIALGMPSWSRRRNQTDGQPAR